VIVLPPSDAGALQLTSAEVMSGRAETPVGGPGKAAGTMDDEGDEGLPVPAELVAVTVNV
jgi:hypothetical protein